MKQNDKITFVQKCHKYFMHDNDNIMCRFLRGRLLNSKQNVLLGKSLIIQT